jgi:carbon-monoxide dehydrogenase medium subunit
VKPPVFSYAVPETVSDAVDLLKGHGDEAKILAGGQSLVPLLNLRLARPEVLIDVNRIRDLDGIDSNGALTIGAITRQRTVAESAAVAGFAPIVVDALRHVGHPATRARGTFGGTIAHADPAAELPAVLLALDGEVDAQGPSGPRTIAAEDLFRGYFTTELAGDEVLVKVRLRRPLDGARWAFLEVARRHGDFALVGVAAVAWTDGETCTDARVALFGVGPVPTRAREAEALLQGRPLGTSSFAGDVARAAAAGLSPVSDIHATGLYRREVAEVLVRRAVESMFRERP